MKAQLLEQFQFTDELKERLVCLIPTLIMNDLKNKLKIRIGNPPASMVDCLKDLFASYSGS